MNNPAMPVPDGTVVGKAPAAPRAISSHLQRKLQRPEEAARRASESGD